MGSGRDERYNMSTLVQRSHKIGTVLSEAELILPVTHSNPTRKTFHCGDAELSTFYLGLHQLE